MHKSALLSLSCLGFAAQAPAVNLISNSGFETGSLSSWTPNGNASGTNWHIATDQVHSGDFSAEVNGNALLEQTFAPTATASITEVSAWVKQDPGALFVIDLLYQDGSDTVFFATPAETGFVKYDLTDMLDPGKRLTTLQVYGYDGGTNGPTWLDDVTVQAIPEPAAFAPLALGLVAVRRRRS